MRIITISRQFGSMGRVFGKKLAEELGFHYYDKQIISEVSKCADLDENYVADTLEKGIDVYPYTCGVTFSLPRYNKQMMDVVIAQCEILKRLAQKGDCVIVGRSADAILSEYEPFNIFVYADMATRVARCKEREKSNETLTDRETERLIKEIDKGRARSHTLFSSSKWGEKEGYHLMLNTTDCDVEVLAKSIAKYVDAYFASKNR